jgi:hypothetical protein
MAMLWQGLLTASEVISPAFVMLLLLAAGGGVIHSKNTAASAMVGLMLAATGGLAWLTFSNRTSRWQSALCLARDVAATLSVALFLGFALDTIPLPEAILMTAPCVLMAMLIAASMSGQRWAALRHLPLYLLTDRLISFVLYGYALANMHNVTWGTKGLTVDQDQQTEKQSMRRLRNIIAASIVAVDAGLIGVGTTHSGLWMTSSSCVVEFFVLLSLAVTGCAAAAGLASASRSFFLPRLAPFALFLQNGARSAPTAGPIVHTGATRAA